MMNDELKEWDCASPEFLFPQFIIHHSSFIIYLYGWAKKFGARRHPCAGMQRAE
jgi:hypothetical protein